MKNISQFLAVLLLILTTLSMVSCETYLDVKPDQKQQIPTTLADCQALLANTAQMNSSFSSITEIAADDYYVTVPVFTSMEQIDRDGYAWKPLADVNFGIWSAGYTRVLTANQVLKTLDELVVGSGEQNDWNHVKGSALIFRAISFYDMAQVWSKPYDATTAGQDLGVPIRLTPDLAEKTTRGTVQATYDRIIKDLKAAAELLPAIAPATSALKMTTLTKAAALSLLARTYLAMNDYANAGATADAVLQQYSTLIDYQQLPPGMAPELHNSEIIFFATRGFSIPIYYGNISPELFSLYPDVDLRPQVFFEDTGNGTYSSKWCVAGGPAGFGAFAGIATPELYLIRAESYARAGNTTAAMSDLNTLLAKRSDAGFVPLVAANEDAALVLILKERRKELLFCGIRWTDLRRLNKESRFAETLTRDLNGQTFTLPPNDPRYVLNIPLDVLKYADIPQNPR